MTISYVRGDIFTSKAQVLVNPVNLVGAMGRGLARDFRDRDYAMYRTYADACRNGSFEPGKLLLLRFGEGKFVLNFPTKYHYRNGSSLHLIELGLAKFVRAYRQRGITSVAFPMLGAGLGGLDWATEVKPLMERYLSGLADIDIYVYVGR